MTMSATTPTKEEIAEFLTGLLRDGRLHPADVEILKAHARLPDRSGEAWQIAEGASQGVVEQWGRRLGIQVMTDILQWSQPPSWHAVDCLYRWLGHAIAQNFPYYSSQVTPRNDGTKRWWKALAEEVRTIDGKCTVTKLRPEIVEAVKLLPTGDVK